MSTDDAPTPTEPDEGPNPAQPDPATPSPAQPSPAQPSPANTDPANTDPANTDPAKPEPSEVVSEATGEPTTTSEPAPAPSPAPVSGLPSVAVPLRWVRAATETRWLVLLAFVIRGAAAFVNPAILNDSAGLVRAARRLVVEGPAIFFVEPLLPHHPLPPTLIALGSFVADPELVATLLSLIGSALAVWPLHALARWACGRHAAAAACILYAALPKAVEAGAVPLAEGFFLPFFLGSLALTIAALEGQRRVGARLAGAGLCAAVAYLCRPEGLIAAPACLAALVIAARRARVRRAGFFLAGFLFLALPYAGLLTHARGRLALSPKKDVARFVGAATTQPIPAAGVPEIATGVPEVPTAPPRTVLHAVRGTIGAYDSALTAPVALLVILGLLPFRRWRRRRSRPPRLLLAGTAAVLGALVVRLQTGWGYGGGRHILASAALLLPFAGEGLAVLGAVLPRVTSRRRFALVLALLLSIPLASRAVLRPAGVGGLDARQLGAELAERSTAAGTLRVASFAEPLVAYYADRDLRQGGGEAVDIPLWGIHGRAIKRHGVDSERLDDLVERLVAERADWIVLDLFRRAPDGGVPHRDVLAGLVERGAVSPVAVARGSEIAAFRVTR